MKHLSSLKTSRSRKQDLAHLYHKANIQNNPTLKAENHAKVQAKKLGVMLFRSEMEVAK